MCSTLAATLLTITIRSREEDVCYGVIGDIGKGIRNFARQVSSHLAKYCISILTLSKDLR